MNTQDAKFFGNKNAKIITTEKERYKESKIITDFLSSKQGIPFLINSQKQRTRDTPNLRSADLHKKIDDFIDFYTCWTNDFPVRKNLKVSKYEFLKSVENFCSKSEISQIYFSKLNE